MVVRVQVAGHLSGVPLRETLWISARCRFWARTLYELEKCSEKDFFTHYYDVFTLISSYLDKQSISAVWPQKKLSFAVHPRNSVKISNNTTTTEHCVTIIRCTHALSRCRTKRTPSIGCILYTLVAFTFNSLEAFILFKQIDIQLTNLCVHGANNTFDRQISHICYTYYLPL